MYNLLLRIYIFKKISYVCIYIYIYVLIYWAHALPGPGPQQTYFLVFVYPGCLLRVYIYIYIYIDYSFFPLCRVSGFVPNNRDQLVQIAYTLSAAIAQSATRISEGPRLHLREASPTRAPLAA